MNFHGKMNFLLFIVALSFGAVMTLGANNLPGADAPEGLPNGCIDCHTDGVSGDFRINITLGQNENHPSVTKTINNQNYLTMNLSLNKKRKKNL